VISRTGLLATLAGSMAMIVIGCSKAEDATSPTKAASAPAEAVAPTLAKTNDVKAAGASMPGATSSIAPAESGGGGTERDPEDPPMNGPTGGGVKANNGAKTSSRNGEPPRDPKDPPMRGDDGKKSK
jgi:hypothetical protein